MSGMTNQPRPLFARGVGTEGGVAGGAGAAGGGGGGVVGGVCAFRTVGEGGGVFGEASIAKSKAVIHSGKSGRLFGGELRVSVMIWRKSPGVADGS